MSLAVGVDLGGTNLRAALIDAERGQVLGEERKEPVADKEPAAVAALVARLVAEVDPAGQRLGVGIGFAGMLRGWTGVVVNAPNFGWREVDFRALLRSAIDPRLELYNDLDAIAFGEASFGAAREESDVLCVFVGTGVGAGIVTDGRLYFGATHLAGEIGHVKVVRDGRLCGCGARGCLEAYASGEHIKARAKAELAQAASLAVELAGGLDALHAGHLDEAAGRGDPYADALWDEVAGHLGMVLGNAVTLLNPSRLVMGGGVWQGAPELRRRTQARLLATANAPSLEGFAMVDSSLGDQSGVLGAAALVARGELHP